MFELLKYWSRQRLRGALALSVGLAGLAAVYVWMYPSFGTDFDFDQYLEQFPEIFREMFNIASMNTIEGFLAAELYAFGWVLLLGVYLAYAAAGTIAGEIDRQRVDILLSLPVMRSRVVLGQYLSLLVPIVLVNVIVPPVVYLSSVLVGYPMPVVELVVVHVLSVPYLLACAAIGLVLSVISSRDTVAQRGALVLMFGLFLFESLVTTVDLDWLGAIAPMRYYDPTAVLVHTQYDLGGAVMVLAAAVGLVVISQVIFTRRDVP
ncbi:MAG: ABC transporter permease subunit [Halorhabdus sp.]